MTEKAKARREKHRAHARKSNDKEKWALWNQILNTARGVVGKPLIPAGNNPYKRRRDGHGRCRPLVARKPKQRNLQ